MLHIVADRLANFIAKPEFIRYPSDYFDVTYEEDWLSSPFGRLIIGAIDQVPLGDDVMYSLLAAGMRPEDLATGTKNLFLCRHCDRLNRLSMMGENCYRYLMDIAAEKEVSMAATAYCLFRDSDLLGRPVHFINHDKVVSSEEEFFQEMIRLHTEGVFSG